MDIMDLSAAEKYLQEYGDIEKFYLRIGAKYMTSGEAFVSALPMSDQYLVRYYEWGKKVSKITMHDDSVLVELVAWLQVVREDLSDEHPLWIMQRKEELAKQLKENPPAVKLFEDGLIDPAEVPDEYFHTPECSE